MGRSLSGLSWMQFDRDPMRRRQGRPSNITDKSNTSLALDRLSIGSGQQGIGA
jgi:hypothetical protein